MHFGILTFKDGFEMFKDSLCDTHIEDKDEKLWEVKGALSPTVKKKVYSSTDLLTLHKITRSLTSLGLSLKIFCLNHVRLCF